MAVLKYKDPETGEVKTVGAPTVDAYSKAESDEKQAETNAAIAETNAAIAETKATVETKAPMYTYGTDDLEAGVTPLESGKLHFVYE